MKPWRRTRSTRVQDCRVFGVDRVRFRSPDDDRDGEFFVVRLPEWINVIPLTDDDRVVMVRQYRFGVEGFTLEIPGGMCDPEEQPIDAARRELLEETGFETAEITPLGWVHPNPAIQDNRCHSFLARGLTDTGSQKPDTDEELEVTLVPLAEIPRLIRDGTITHSLVISAFHLLDNR